MSFDDLTEEQKESLRGPQGAPGYTPVKGVDFWTTDDQSAIVSEVLSKLPKYNIGEY